MRACALLWVKSQPCLAGHDLPILSLSCGTWFLLVLKNHGSSILNVTILQKTFQAYLSLRTQDLLPDEKVVREDGEGKLRAPHPQPCAECCWRVLALSHLCLGRRRTSKPGASNAEQQNNHLTLFACDGLHVRSGVLHEVELFLPQKAFFGFCATSPIRPKRR